MKQNLKMSPNAAAMWEYSIHAMYELSANNGLSVKTFLTLTI
jgi:hypothetical protein